MMVGHHDVDAALNDLLYLVFCRDAVIDRDDERWRARFDHSVERTGGKTVALVKSVRNKRVNGAAKVAQCLGEQTG